MHCIRRRNSLKVPLSKDEIDWYDRGRLLKVDHSNHLNGKPQLTILTRKRGVKAHVKFNTFFSIRSAATDQQKAAGSTSSSSEATQQAQSGSQVTNIYSSGGAATPSVVSTSRLHQHFPGSQTSRAGSAPNALHRASTMPSSTASVGNVRFASSLSSPATATTPSGSLLKRALANRVMVQETQNSQARVTPSQAMTSSTASTTSYHGASNGSIPHASPTRTAAVRKGGTQSTPIPFSTIQNRKRAEFLSGDEGTALVDGDGSCQQRGLEAEDGVMDRNQGQGQRGGSISLGSDQMSTSILASAAWYRDAAGRTGFQPEEWNWSSVPNLQSSVVKDMRGRSQTDNNGEARRSPSSASLPPIPTIQAPMRTGYAQLRGSCTRENSLHVPTGSPPSRKTIGSRGRGSFTSPTQTQIQHTAQQTQPNAERGTGDQGNGDYDNLDLASFGMDDRVQASSTSVNYDGVAAHIKSVTFSDRVEVNEIEGSFDEEEEENDVRDELLAAGEEDLDLSNFDTERIATRPSLLELCVNATQLHSMAPPQSPSGSYNRIGEDSPQSNGHRTEHTSLSAGRDKPLVVRSASGYLEANILASLANQLKEQSHQSQQPELSSPGRQLFPSHREADSKLQQSIYDNLVPSNSLSTNPTTSSESRDAHIRAPLASSPFGSPDFDSCDSPPPAASSSEAGATTEEEKWLRAKFLAMYANRGNQLPGVGTNATSDPTQPPPKDPFQSPSSPPEYGGNGGHDGDAPLAGAGNKTATMTGREFERRTSFESALSSDSRESVVSAASIRAENKVRRYFNY